jgi:hypothetical protein
MSKIRTHYIANRECSGLPVGQWRPFEAVVVEELVAEVVAVFVAAGIAEVAGH